MVRTKQKSTDGRAPSAPFVGALPRPPRPAVLEKHQNEAKLAAITEEIGGMAVKRKDVALKAKAAKAADEPAGAPMDVDVPAPVERQVVPSLAPEKIRSKAWDRGLQVCNLEECVYCAHGGDLYQCDRRGCPHLMCAKCVLGIAEGLKLAAAEGKRPWLICRWCWGPHCDYHGLVFDDGTLCGPPLRIVATVKGKGVPRLERRPIALLHLRLDTPELSDDSQPFDLFRTALRARYPKDEFSSHSIKFSLQDSKAGVVADAHHTKMKGLASTIRKNLKSDDFEVIFFVTTHVTSEGAPSDLGHLQVIPKSVDLPEGLSVGPFDFFNAAFGDVWREIMQNHHTTVFMMTCGALISERDAREQLLDAAALFKIDMLLAPTTPVSEPTDFSAFVVSWAKEVTWARVDPSVLMHELIASGGLDRCEAGIAVYYGAGTAGLAHESRLVCDVPAPTAQSVEEGPERPARMPVPGFIRYLWHSPPLVLYGEPVPLACPRCSLFRRWKLGKVPNFTMVRSVCKGCGWVIERHRPVDAREVAGNRGAGRWLTVVSR